MESHSKLAATVEQLLIELTGERGLNSREEVRHVWPLLREWMFTRLSTVRVAAVSKMVRVLESHIGGGQCCL